MTLSRLDLDGASGVSGVGVVQPGFQDSVNAEALNSVAQTHQQPVDWTNSFASTSQLIPEVHLPQSSVKAPDFRNHPSFSFEGPSDRKTKSVQSCTECRRRKIKCDRVFPCGPCKIRDEPDICVEYIKTKVAEPSGYTLVSDFRILASRTERIENFLQTLYSGSSSVARDSAEDNANPRLDHAQPSDRQDEMPDNVIWDASFQQAFGGDQETSGSILQQFSQPAGPNLPGQHAMQASAIEESQAPTYTFNSDTLPSMPPMEGSSRLGPITASNEVLQHQSAEIQRSRSSSPSDTDHEAALALEDMALNRHHARLKTLFAGTPAYDYRQLPPPSLGPLVSLQSVLSDWHRTPVLLPDLRQLRVLANDFVHRYLWIQRCLHVPSFNHELETFLTSAAERGGDIYFEPKFVSFASLLFAICATSIHFASTDDCARYGVSPGTQSSACTQWVDAALTLLHKAEWLQRHDVLALQTVLVLGPILSGTDRGEMHWAMIGSAIKVAQAMNFCNLVSETIYAEKAGFTRGQMVPGQGKSSLPLAREIGRRIWSHLVEVDWLFASEHNFAYSVHPSQNRTAEVSNMNDNDLTLAIVMRPLPEHIWTESSYTIWKDRMIHPYREFLDGCLTPSKPALNLIQECDAKLNQLAADLPAFYQMSTDLSAIFPNADTRKQVRVERIAIQSGLHTRLLRVHRTVLRRAYRNHKYDVSREACIKSASTLLELAEEWLKTDMVIAGWWPVVYGCFSASVVLFITMCRDERLSAHESSITRAIHIIRSLPGPVSAKRTHMASMLEKLMNGRRKKLTNSNSQGVVPAKRKHYSEDEHVSKDTPLDDQMDRFVDRLVAKTPTSSTGGGGGVFHAEQRSDQGSSVDNTFYTGDNLNTFDFNFDFGNYGDPFADIMRMTEASAGGSGGGGNNNVFSSQTLWPWE